MLAERRKVLTMLRDGKVSVDEAEQMLDLLVGSEDPSADELQMKLIGESPAMKEFTALIAKAARSDIPLLIVGETGTGKGLAAHAVHGLSTRRERPFVVVNCGAVPEGLVESDLFGHEMGAFTGAVSRKLGKVELAEGGTLVLDEIGDLALGAQPKLPWFLEERMFERVGGKETLRANVRVIAATNRDLGQMVAEGQFREDLYYRLQTLVIRVPPLRDRKEDIPLLASHFLARIASHLGREEIRLTPEALAALQEYDWPGNVRELEHVLHRAAVLCDEDAIGPEDLSLGKG